jgi:thiol:disulfide interchange protein
MMWAQGEADAYAPALLGVALWVLWRLPTGWITLILSELLAWIGAGLLAERALPHQVFTGEGWRHVALSFTLALCAALLILSSLLLLGERRRKKYKKKSAQAKPERS